MIGVLQLLEQKLIFFLAEIDLLAVDNQIGGLFLLISRVRPGKGQQGEETEREYYTYGG